MWSSISIPGVPRILMADTTQNRQGWEHAFSNRLYQSLKKSGLHMEADAPLHTSGNQLTEYEFNSLLIFAHSQKDVLETPGSQNVSPYLLAICSTDGFDAESGEWILKSNPPIAPIIIAPLSAMSPREAGLFYLKFFTELKLHSKESISGKMVWFSFSKAKELLKRRRYPAKFGVRC
ncbi:hypothetical protein L0152_26345 [bacterium]|nr:hypothetical protein [bacterium]